MNENDRWLGASDLFRNQLSQSFWAQEIDYTNDGKGDEKQYEEFFHDRLYSYSMLHVQLLLLILVITMVDVGLT